MELHAVFKGTVQGVGFRWTVVEHAENHQLAGTVKNLSDGRVEVYAYGSKESLEAFLKAVQQVPGSARIDEVKSYCQHSQKNPTDFIIIH